MYMPMACHTSVSTHLITKEPQVSNPGEVQAWLTMKMSNAPAGRLAVAYSLLDAKTTHPESGVQPGMVSSQGPSVSLIRPLASPSVGMMYRFL